MATSGGSAPSDERPAVLIVDDDPGTLVAVESILEGAGYRLVRASSGHEALRKVLADDFAVILLDLRMPGLDGLEVARLIKARPRTHHVPIMFLTGAGGPDPAALAYATGAVDYLEKPVRPEVVRAKVASLVQLYRRARELRAEAAQAGERALLAQEERARRRYRTLAEAIPQIVWTAQADGAVVYVNRRFERYTGTEAEAALGWGWVAQVHPEDTAGLLDRWRAAIVQHEPFEGEARLRAADGSWRWHLWRAEPERDEEGQVVAWLGTATDIEEQKQAHAAARAAVAARDEFLSVASHELRTPLTALALSLQVLRTQLERAGGTKPVAERLSAVQRHIDRLTRLVNQLLDVARIEGGQLAIEREACDLGELVAEVVARLQPEARRAGCTIRAQVERPIRGCWDRLGLDQVVTNVLSNAIKYGANKPIDVSLARTDRGVRLVIRDRGIGISGEDLTRIFERFTRAVPWRAYGGLGLGLYITRQIVAAHGGEISADGRPGEGATFTIELPLALPPCVPVVNVPDAEPAAAGAPDVRESARDA